MGATGVPCVEAGGKKEGFHDEPCGEEDGCDCELDWDSVVAAELQVLEDAGDYNEGAEAEVIGPGVGGGGAGVGFEAVGDCAVDGGAEGAARGTVEDCGDEVEGVGDGYEGVCADGAAV